MCGIFGLLRYSQKPMDLPAIIASLFRKSECRGKDASGYAWNRGDEMVILKAPMDPEKFIAEGYVTSENIPGDINAIICHNRHATIGDPKEVKNNHPFWSEDYQFAMIHNGVVHTKYKGGRQLETVVDSEIILRGIEDGMDDGKGMLESIVDEVKTYGGSQTIAVLSAEGLWLSRHSNPLWFAYVVEWDALVFASTNEILRDGVKEFLPLTLGFFLPYNLIESPNDQAYEILPGKEILSKTIPSAVSYGGVSRSTSWQTYSWRDTERVAEASKRAKERGIQATFLPKKKGTKVNYVGLGDEYPMFLDTDMLLDIFKNKKSLKKADFINKVTLTSEELAEITEAKDPSFYVAAYQDTPETLEWDIYYYEIDGKTRFFIPESVYMQYENEVAMQYMFEAEEEAGEENVSYPLIDPTNGVAVTHR